MPLAVPFFSGLASATSPSTIFLIASMSEGGGETGGGGGVFEGRDRAGPPPPPLIGGGVGAAILSHSGVQGEVASRAREVVVGATGSGAGWLVGPCAGEEFFGVCGASKRSTSHTHCVHAGGPARVQVV
jgi:hypothetical protein